MFGKTTEEVVCKKVTAFYFRNPLRRCLALLQKHTQTHIPFVATVPIQLQEHQYSEMKIYIFSLKGFFHSGIRMIWTIAAQGLLSVSLDMHLYSNAVRLKVYFLPNSPGTEISYTQECPVV